MEKANHGHLPLLRQRRLGPRRCATKPCDEFSPSHSITSSANASSFGDISMPGVRACNAAEPRNEFAPSDHQQSPPRLIGEAHTLLPRLS
jgi:hypothetical protein